MTTLPDVAGGRAFAVDVDALPQAVVAVDPVGRVRAVNRTWCSMFGHDPVATVGSDWRRYLHPKDSARFYEGLERVFEESLTLNMILRVIDGSGGNRWSDVYLRALGDDAGPMAVMTVSDIGERVGQERLLLARQRSINAILDDLPGMVYRCRNTPDWPMEYVSGGCLELTGYHASDVIRSRKVAYGSLIIAEDKELVWNEVQNGLREKRRFELVYRIRTAAGELKWVWERGKGIYSADGELSGIEGVIIDFNRQVMHRTTGVQRVPDADDLVDEREFYARLDARLAAARGARLYSVNLDRYEHYMAHAGFEQLRTGSRFVAGLLRGIVGEEGLVYSPQPDRWYVYSDAPRAIEEEIEAIEDAFLKPIRLAGRNLYVSVSIGCARLACGAVGADRLVGAAHAAMVHCLQTGGGSSHVREIGYP